METTTNDKFLDARKMAASVIDRYKSSPRSDAVRVLLLGEKGSGKSVFLSTCPRPVHIDSFDPGGVNHLRPEIEKGWVIPDTQWEGDDPFNPDRYLKWKKTFLERKKSGYFDHIGTYALDSSTTWANAIMNWILKQDGRPGTVPQFTKDFNPQKTEIVNRLKEMMDLPCSFILTGHLDVIKDEISGGLYYRFMTTGKGTVTIPLEFDELWVMEPKKSAKGLDYRIITERTGPHLAATRLGRGKFETYEVPDMMSLLKKAGRNIEHKPLLTI
jgi:hypothetical protein